MRRIEVNYKLVNFEDFDLVHENENIEYKESFDKLPGDIWPTYSAFANTKGGLIILGVSEDNGNYEEVGVSNASKIIQDLHFPEHREPPESLVYDSGEP